MGLEIACTVSWSWLRSQLNTRSSMSYYEENNRQGSQYSLQVSVV